MDAEVGRARGPGCADARGREHRNDRLGHVRQEAGDDVARPDPVLREPGRDARHLGAQLAPGELAPVAALVAKDDRGLRVRAGRSRFSAKLSRAPGNQRAPGMRSLSSSAGPAPRVPLTPQKSHNASQNAPGSATDQR